VNSWVVLPDGMTAFRQERPDDLSQAVCGARPVCWQAEVRSSRLALTLPGDSSVCYDPGGARTPCLGGAKDQCPESSHVRGGPHSPPSPRSQTDLASLVVSPLWPLS
jgi:hypothetical protein